MESIIEALPEIAIACILAAVFFWLSKDKLSKATRTKSLVVFAAALGIWLIMLGQSGSVPAQLQVTEQAPDYQQPLAEVQDTSPETLTAEESNERLEALRQQQKQGTSLEDESKAEDDEDGTEQ